MSRYGANSGMGRGWPPLPQSGLRANIQPVIALLEYGGTGG